ncbi:MAG: glycosyltransferase, partial [Alphaproteobacteria bacterium]|nr:glycosyltransferase [Alphaproteobacteria bacterium]
DQIYAGEKFLLATTRAFDFAPEEMTEFVQYVGPQLDDNLWSRPWVSPFAEADKRPLVLVGFSTTFQNHADCLQRAIDALAELPVRAVVTLGGAIRPDEVSAAANTAIVESAPHNVLMKDAALVVTHGGHGTLTKALVHGLPQLVIPHGRDQVDNAVRVTHRGAGLSLDPSASVGDIRAALVRLLNEPAFAAAAMAFGERIRSECATCDIVSTLEGLVRQEGRLIA